MAEQDKKQKIEQPTEKHLSDSTERGQFATPHKLAWPVFIEALSVPLASFPCETQPAIPDDDLRGLPPRLADNAQLRRIRWFRAVQARAIRDTILARNAAAAVAAVNSK
jgi:hypothetical protein